MGVTEKIAEIEAQMAKTQVNKATEHHLGMLKAKLARLREAAEASGSKGGGGGGAFEVKKSGKPTVVFIGLPSVGKSTMLNVLTSAASKTAHYAFTTLTVVPGIMEYNGAKIQLLDLPGVISGASKGRGKGRQVLAVARNADLVLLIVDFKDVDYVEKLKAELYDMGIRLDTEPPRIVIERTPRGGLTILSDKPLTHLTEKTIAAVLGEYGIHSATVNFRENSTVDRLIDVLNPDNRRYARSLVVITKLDLASPQQLKKLPADGVKIAAEKGIGIEPLKRAIYEKLALMRIYTKGRFDKVNYNEPLIMRRHAIVAELCDALHRDLRANFKYAEVWGKSAKHPGQRVGIGHVLQDGDVVHVHNR